MHVSPYLENGAPVVSSGRTFENIQLSKSDSAQADHSIRGAKRLTST